MGEKEVNGMKEKYHILYCEERVDYNAFIFCLMFSAAINSVVVQLRP